MNRKTIIEQFGLLHLYDVGGGFIFTWIQQRESNPFEWVTANNATDLDFLYIAHHSGEKYISTFVQHIIELSDNEELPAGEGLGSFMARIVIERFGDKWNRLYDALTTEYNPLENYDMEQTETPDITKERNTKSNTKITNTNEIESAQNNTFGFNSSDAVPSTSSEGKTTTTTEGNEDDNTSWEEETETGTRGLTRHGNIGVTTSQQMLSAEVDVRTKHQFLELIFNDLDSILCLMVY